MKKTLMAWAFASMAVFSTPNTFASTKFGAPLTLAKAQSISQAVAAYGEQKSKEIVVTGKVEKVCQKKGCWMVVADEKLSVRITFKDYGFFVPTSLQGKPIRAQGQLVEKKLSKDEVAHYLEDEGLSPEKAAQQAQAKTVYNFVASGVEITPQS